MRRGLIALAVLASAAAGAVAVASRRWKRSTEAFRADMWASCLPLAMTTYDEREIASLPMPVRKFFRAVLRDGQPMVSNVRLLQRGLFRQSENREKWQPFNATQFITMQPRGFDWDARMRMAPGIDVRVRDTYAHGEGALHAALLGIVTVADRQGGADMAQGELLRYFAESPWYPTALLPSQGVRWEGIDERSARATLTDGMTTVSLVFGFDEEGLVTTAWAASRGRSAGAYAPWRGRFGDYAKRAGMRVPMEAEVEWLLPSGPFVYFRCRLARIDHAFEPR